MKRKCLAVGIILLFIGVAVAPSINSTIVKTSNDFVEVTSQACGIQGFGNTTVKLTKEQYQNLEQYLVDFRARLNQTTTREEAVPIFKDAVVELNKFGLLPNGMSVEQAQNFITHNSKSTNALKKIPSVLSSSGFSNSFCMIAGRATNCFLAGFITSSLQLIISSLYDTTNSEILETILYMISFLFFWFLLFRNKWEPFNEILSFFSIMSLLTFGGTDSYQGTNPTEGWIYTAGLQGIKNFSGSFFGKIHYPVTSMFGTLYTGAFGFTGIKIQLSYRSWFYLGFALKVNISHSL
jgi:hypothetical protein